MTKEDAIEYIKLWCPYDKQNEIIEALSVEPQKMGTWVSTIVKEKGWNGKERQFYQPISCSVCRKPNHVESNYCPNCGAKMEVKGDKE